MTNLFEDIKRGAGTLTGLDGLQQSLFVDDATPSTVDYTHAPLTLRQRLAVNQICKCSVPSQRSCFTNQHHQLISESTVYRHKIMHVEITMQ